MSYELHHGDCAQVMSRWEDDSVDALVTDPPSGIGFMSKDWDDDRGGWQQWVAWLAEVMREAKRVMKPGAHGLVWALPRTSYWTAGALDLAGFEVRDRFTHIFGQGFPKSKNLGEGRGTALKPAVEDWWLVRKPLSEKSLEKNIERWGTGGLNIDVCRVATDENPSGRTRAAARAAGRSVQREAGTWANDRRSAETYLRERPEEALGRWPAHLVLDDTASAALDEQTATLRVGGNLNGGEGGDRRVVSPLELGPRGPWQSYGDKGGASRFFFRYVAKPGHSEREFGCEGLPLKTAGEATGRKDGSAGLKSPRAGAGRTSGARNHHPTLKPVALMRYLCRLITPAGGIVLDPFMGSGTTGIAALREGLQFVGIEKQLDYLGIAAARVSAAKEQHEAGEDAEVEAGERDSGDPVGELGGEGSASAA